jgi:general secretion pathway protein E
MPTHPPDSLETREFLALMDRTSSGAELLIPEFIAKLLRLLCHSAASDVHIEPAENELFIRYRIDGVLQPLAKLPSSVAPNVIARLKVLANLLTYESNLPQEGSIRDEASGMEIRISTFPTVFGEKAVLRVLAAPSITIVRLEQLGLPTIVAQELQQALSATSGAILIAGPAGSGKTTTACACLREIVAQSQGGRSIASLEDPVETVIAGVAQTQVNAASGFDIAAALRFLLRQDPEVIFVGEIRDTASATTALQAALTGQLVLTTFHAGNCREAIRRLIECGVPAYAVSNAVRIVVAQRLVRRLCDCAVEADPKADALPLGLQVSRCRIARGCAGCRETGYRGRALLAEMLDLHLAHNREFLFPAGPASAPSQLESHRASEPFWRQAEELVEKGVTSPLEVVRVLGFRSALQVGE